MRWIQRGANKSKRGKGEPPAIGDVHFVDEQGSMAIVGGRLYINGQPAPAGTHEIDLPDLPAGQTLAVDVDSQGKTNRKVKARKPKADKPKGGK